MLTGSNLFIKNLSPVGEHKCYYCGYQCDNKYSVKEYVKDTFTNRDIIQFPNSIYVCKGCSTVNANKGYFQLVNGENIENMLRNYSWVLTREKNVAYSKSHIQLIREVILNPPEPPFTIVIAVSGQKQLLFRSKVSLTKDFYPLLFEEKHMIIDISELKECLQLATKICAVIGKMSLKENIETSKVIKYYETYGDIKDIEFWYKNNQQIIYQLAAYLCEPMELCKAKMEVK